LTQIWVEIAQHFFRV